MPLGLAGKFLLVPMYNYAPRRDYIMQAGRNITFVSVFQRTGGKAIARTAEEFHSDPTVRLALIGAHSQRLAALRAGLFSTPPSGRKCDKWPVGAGTVYRQSSLEILSDRLWSAKLKRC